MCGLIAVITKNSNGFNKDQVDAFNDLLYLDALRGMDSTGVFCVDKDGNMDLAKEATSAGEFRPKKEYRGLLDTAFKCGRALVGHNRAATRGVITDDNAHPFVVDDRITLIHNGTLYGDWAKLTDKKVDVDSNAIAHKIHECGDDVEKALQQVTGAFALIWHDFKNNTLNFIRNEQRPLYWLETANGWIWASEANMIHWACVRHNMKAEGKIEMLTAGVHTQYDFSDGTWALDSKPLVITPPVKTYYPQTNYQHGHRLVWPDEEADDGVIVPFKAHQTSTNVTKPPEQTALQQRQQGYGEYSARASSVGKTITYENEVFSRNGCNISVTEFADIGPGLAADRSDVWGTPFDFNNVKEGSDAHGWWLYAKLDRDPRFVIRMFIDAKHSDRDLLDLCINSKSCKFKVASRQWRVYHDVAQGSGVGIINACDITVKEPSPV